MITPNDPSSIKLIQQDLKQQVPILRNLISLINKNEDIEKNCDQAQAIIQTLTYSFQQLGFSYLQNLLNTLDAYFEALKKGLTFQPTHLEILSVIIGELLQIADFEKKSFDISFKTFQVRFTQAIDKLNQFINQFYTKQKENKELTIPGASNTLSLQFEDVTIDAALFDLLRSELEAQCLILNRDLLDIEKKGASLPLLESLMRGAHSIKGAASVLALQPIVQLAHKMEDCFVEAKQNALQLKPSQIDVLLQATDLLSSLAKIKESDINSWMRKHLMLIQQLIQQMNAQPSKIVENQPYSSDSKPLTKPVSHLNKNESKKTFQTNISQDRILRVTAQNLNRLMGLAGESLVESRWLYPFGQLLQKLKQQHNELADQVDILRDQLGYDQLNESVQRTLTHLQYKTNEVRSTVNERLRELDNFIRRHASLSDRLYQEVINSRMRPFADGVEGLSRLVRDLSRQLGKQVKFEIEGKSTPIDRDILEKLELPLNHLIRNAIDHGIESTQERLKLGKPAEGTIHLEARHRGGILAITFSDDGRGIDIKSLRQKIIEKNLVSAEIAPKLSDAEVIDFIYLPGFSTASELTEISGRGMGLNIIQNFVQDVGGIVRTVTNPGKGLTIDFQLPLTLSVIRALLVDIAGEPYAFPLARIDQAFLIPVDTVEMIENRQFFHYEGKNIGLVAAWDVLELEKTSSQLAHIPVIVLSDRINCYGLVVDRLIGEKELVVQELDPRLGKVSDIASGALMEDGNPVLIIDVEDIVRSIDHLLSGGRLARLSYHSQDKPIEVKRILVVDDSITVREVECRLLENQGYFVETAVNGMDGWNAIRTSHYDLIITDIDMPRMNGIDLVKAIKADTKLQTLPVMIVSYKEGEEDRMKGLEAGADYYLTKSSFHDATLLDAVKDLIGPP